MLTQEDKQLIAEYMGWKLSEWRMIDGSAHVVNPHFFDLNDAALCVQEMQKRGELHSFLMMDTFNQISSWSDFIADLFNAENFFNAMSEWLKDGDGV